MFLELSLYVRRYTSVREYLSIYFRELTLQSESGLNSLPYFVWNSRFPQNKEDVMFLIFPSMF